MTTPIHLNEGDYAKNFPADLDQFPEVIDREHYIDAWQFNTIFNSIVAIEQYLIDYKASIEAPEGNDVIGDDGQFEIPIPPALYKAYKSVMAWDSDLLEENIKKDVTIFGVTGTLEIGAGGWPFSVANSLSVIAEDPVSASLSLTVPAVPAVSATLSAA